MSGGTLLWKTVIVRLSDFVHLSDFDSYGNHKSLHIILSSWSFRLMKSNKISRLRMLLLKFNSVSEHFYKSNQEIKK